MPMLEKIDSDLWIGDEEMLNVMSGVSSINVYTLSK